MSNETSNGTRGDSTGQPITEATSSQQRASHASNRSPFRIPPAVRGLFEHFPLVTYPRHDLPLRAPIDRSRNILYIFATTADAAADAPSFNPTCLKWQTYLHIHGIPFSTAPSTNHAAPHGALPYLIPRYSAATAVPQTSSTLPRWIRSQSEKSQNPPTDPQHLQTTATETLYTSLLSGPIRLAYLYTVYLHPPTFRLSAELLYVQPASNSSFVRACLTPSLRQAALDEILNYGRTSTGGKVDVESLFTEAEQAFEALSVLLGKGKWFENASMGGGGDETEENGIGNGDGQGNGHGDEKDSGSGGPGMLDAAVFSYTHVILWLFGAVEQGKVEEEAWSPAVRLVEAISKHGNLIRHRDRLLKKYYRQSSG